MPHHPPTACIRLHHIPRSHTQLVRAHTHTHRPGASIYRGRTQGGRSQNLQGSQCALLTVARKDLHRVLAWGENTAVQLSCAPPPPRVAQQLSARASRASSPRAHPCCVCGSLAATSEARLHPQNPHPPPPPPLHWRRWRRWAKLFGKRE